MRRINVNLYEKAISKKATKLAKTLPPARREESIRIATELFEFSRELAYIGGFVKAGDPPRETFNTRTYRNLLDKYTEQVFAYATSFQPSERSLEALKILQSEREVIGTGNFGLDLIEGKYQNIPNLADIRLRLVEIKKMSEREFANRDSLSKIAGAFEDKGNTPSVARGTSQYIPNPQLRNLPVNRS